MLRLRNYLLDHIQRLTFTYHDKTQTGELIQRATSDVDTIRRFFAEQAIESGRIVLLFVGQLHRALFHQLATGVFSVIVIPIVLIVSFFFFRRCLNALRALSGAGGQALQHVAGESERRAGGQGLRPPGIRRRQVRG